MNGNRPVRVIDCPPGVVHFLFEVSTVVLVASGASGRSLTLMSVEYGAHDGSGPMQIRVLVQRKRVVG